MEFTRKEKLAILKMVDYVILADSKVDPAEMNFLIRLMDRFDFNSLFVGQARNLNKVEAYNVIRLMPLYKKKRLVELLDEVAHSDGFLHEKEIIKITEVLDQMKIDRESSYNLLN